MFCDPKFRNDSAYLFFLLLVKELIQLKRCKTTYFRQATRLDNLSKQDVINVEVSLSSPTDVRKQVKSNSFYFTTIQVGGRPGGWVVSWVGG